MRFECPFCEQRFMEMDDLIEHLETCRDKLINANILSAYAKERIQLVHLLEDWYLCYVESKLLSAFRDKSKIDGLLGETYEVLSKMTNKEVKK